MNKVLKFLSGKKSVIASLIGAVTSFLLGNGIIDLNTAMFIGSISTIVFGATSIATQSAYKK